MSRREAIVIGGSIAGLLAARVLAEQFESVTIVESDKLPDRPESRRGVPQSVQPHVLLTRGYRILEELFPGIGAQLSAAGALSIDWAREFHHFLRSWHPLSVDPSAIVSFTCSRPLLEWTIRQRLQAFPQVQFLAQHRVTGLLASAGAARITGVQVQTLQAERVAKPLPAQLVVDASGRRSNAPQWFAQLGLTPPPETVVNPYLGYATRRYREPAGFQSDWKVLLISQQPPDATRLGYLARIEGGEWIATLGGYGRDFPPLDEAGFLDFARSLPSDRFYEYVRSAEPASPIYAHRATANRLRHYEKIDLPLGFVALGDAVCALCPVYGQGMTVSALSAEVLRDWLRADRSLPPARFHQRLAKSNALHWMLATQQDSRFPTTAGSSPPSRLGKLLGWYAQRLLQTANSDEALHLRFTEVAHLLRSPLALYAPEVMLRVLSTPHTEASP